MEYRREIDGLRALAIIPVIIYHAGLGIFNGGFAGVDVFFVISGYLISSIILQKINQDDFSFREFYERRFRRIFPALFAMSMTCFIAGWAYMPPDDMHDFSKSLGRTFLFISNIYFYKHSGYFDVAAELKPLLHTWSLSVEEQYYILFPPLLLFLYRRVTEKYLSILVLTFLLISLAISQYLISSNPQASYYLIQSRGWELMLGAFLAIRMVEAKGSAELLPHAVREFVAAFGVLLIIGSALWLDKETAFPGIMALPPTLGTVLVIAYGRADTFTGRLLGLGAMVRIGLISYSLYLWHQPVLALARIVLTQEPSRTEICFLLVLVLILSYLSWRWIETPFRDRSTVSPKAFTTFVALGFICVLSFGYWGSIDGFKNRFANIYQAHPQLLGEDKRVECVDAINFPDKGIRLCTFGDRSSSYGVALWGDSHAEMLMSALDEEMKKSRIKGIRIQAKGCEPIPGILEEDYFYALRSQHESCREKYDFAFNIIQQQTRATIVSLRWTYHVYPVPGLVEKMHFDNKEGGVEAGKSKKQVVLDERGHFSIEGDAKKAAIHDLLKNLSRQDRPLIVVYPVPEVGWDVSRRTLQNLIMNRPENSEEITTSYAVYSARHKFINTVLDDWSGPRVHRIRPDEFFCDASTTGRCMAKTATVSYYTDDDHLSHAGARLVAERVIRALVP